MIDWYLSLEDRQPTWFLWCWPVLFLVALAWGLVRAAVTSSEVQK